MDEKKGWACSGAPKDPHTYTAPQNIIIHSILSSVKFTTWDVSFQMHSKTVLTKLATKNK